MSIDAIEDNTEVKTPDGHTGRVRLTRRERKLIAQGKPLMVKVTGTDGIGRSFDIRELVKIEHTQEPPDQTETLLRLEEKVREYGFPDGTAIGDEIAEILTELEEERY